MAARFGVVVIAAWVIAGHDVIAQHATVTPAEAAPFIGTWVIAMTNPAGAQETVRIVEENGRVSASVQLGKFPASDVTGMVRDGDVLVLTTTRRENGVPIWVVMALTVEGDTMRLAQMLERSETIKRGTGSKQR
jgi:hypothetical protein